MDFAVFSDMAAVIIPLFHSFARVGCFLGGCCYGIESKFGFTAHGNHLVPDVNDVSRFPVQLLEAALNLVLFFLLYYIYKRSLTSDFLKGKIMFIYL
jgi:phosphatidylglycerol:prolipoprotein diacylglycerol transferase